MTDGADRQDTLPRQAPTWAILLRNQPERGTIFPWLRVVAVHEAHRLSAIERRDTHLEALATVVSWEEVIAGPEVIDGAHST